MQKNNRLQKAKLLVGDNEVMTASPYTLRRYMARNHSYNGDVDGRLHTINGREYVQNASGMLFPLSRTSIPYSGTGKLPSMAQQKTYGYRPINTTRYRGVKSPETPLYDSPVYPETNITVKPLHGPWPNTEDYTTQEWNNGRRAYYEGQQRVRGASSPTAFTPEESSVLDLINQNATTRRAKPRNFSRNSSFPTKPVVRQANTQLLGNLLDSPLDSQVLDDLLNQPLRGSAASVVGAPPVRSTGRAVRGATGNTVQSTVASEIGRKVKPRIVPVVESGVERASRSGLGRKTMRIAGKVWGKLPWWAKLGVGVAGGIGGAYAVDQTIGRILPRKQQAPPPPPTPTAELGKRMGKSMTKSMTTPKITKKHNNKYF